MQLAHIHARVALRPLQGDDERFDGGHRGPEGIGGKTGIDDVDARLDRLDVGHRGHAAGVMGVEMQGKLGDLLQRRDEIVDVVGRDDPGHILDADAVGAHRLERFALVHEIVEIEDVAAEAGLGQGVADRALEVLPVGLDPLHAGLEISEIVQGVEDPEDVDPDFAGFVHEGPDDVVGIIAVADQILSAEQHA